MLKANSLSIFVLVVIFLFQLYPSCAVASTGEKGAPRKFIHGIMSEIRADHLFSTKTLYGNEFQLRYVEWMPSVHLKYQFAYGSKTNINAIYGRPYQGIGVGRFVTGAPRYVGNPFAIYVFQGGRIGQLSKRLSLNYEWNFGVSMGWKPYDETMNPVNIVVGSKLNAYINGNVNLNWQISPTCDIVCGANITHFSNGNTNLPNAGINAVGGKLGFTYRVNSEKVLHNKSSGYVRPFKKHFSYELIFYASQRQGRVSYLDQIYPAQGKYNVGGINFVTYYNLNYKFRVGIAIDGLYNESANLQVLDDIIGTYSEYVKAPFKHQLGMGASLRGEYVMPIFTIGLGLGRNFIGYGDFAYNYQIFSLKMNISRHVMLHVGYNLRNFKEPNHLMLGIAFRINNRYPRL